MKTSVFYGMYILCFVYWILTYIDYDKFYIQKVC
jgi:hypothetical protein